MRFADWLIVVLPLLFIIGAAIYSGKYTRSVVDFLAAGRVAGRYVISVGDLTAALSVITLVAGSEASYQTGFGVSFWQTISVPVSIVLGLTGFCTYRWRETRCLSKGQFIELRYGSKFFRIVTAFVSTISEMITNAIGPAIAANFFIYYMGLPHRIMIFGVSLPCYGILVALCLCLATILIWPAGRISLLITDCFQGLISYPIFVAVVGFILLRFSYDVDLAPVLWDRVPGESFMDPYDVKNLRDFNIFALIVTLVSSTINRASWIGNDTTNSARTPHEQKMAGILGSWRNGFAYMMITLIAIIVVVFMNSETFSSQNPRNSFKTNSNVIRKQLAERVIDEVVEEPVLRQQVIRKVQAIPDIVHKNDGSAKLSQKENLDTKYLSVVKKELGDSPEGRMMFQKCRTLFQQMMMPTVLKNIFPVGILGLFCLLMVMLLISTDDSRIFNAAGCIVQDMILPFFKGHISVKQHLLLLRLTTLGVAIFFFVVAIFFSQMDYINMFTTIMCALWLGGAGPIMVGGLYTRFGNLTGAWCAIIFGSGTSLLGLIFQRNWTATIYPWLEKMELVAPLDKFLVTVSSPLNPWVVWKMDPFKFPINSFEILGISLFLSISTYIIGSFLTYKPYDLDKLLHRGIYADDNSEKMVPEKINWKNIWGKLIGITSEYTKGDKIIAWSVFVYAIIYQVVIGFLAIIVWNFFDPWPQKWWDWRFFIAMLLIPGIIGIISTVWFLIGGIMDARRLFHDLEQLKEDPFDNGQIGAGNEPEK